MTETGDDLDDDMSPDEERFAALTGLFMRSCGELLRLLVAKKVLARSDVEQLIHGLAENLRSGSEVAGTEESAYELALIFEGLIRKLDDV